MTESKFKSRNGTELFYQTWPSEVKTDKAVIYIHSDHEHSRRSSELIENMDLSHCHTFAYNAMAPGNSPGGRGYTKSISCLVKDLDTFVRHVADTYNIPSENMVVVAYSVGAVVAITWVHDYAPQIRGIVLASPAFRIKPYLHLPMSHMFFKLITRHMKTNLLTHNQTQAKPYDMDKLIATNILELHDTSTRIINDAAAIYTPTLVLSTESDGKVNKNSQKRFFEGLSSSIKEFTEYPGCYHDVIYENGLGKAIDKSKNFILKCFEIKPDTSFLLNSDKTGFSVVEYDRFKGNPGVCKSISYSMQKLIIKAMGILSDGVRLGLKYGFDSGESLNYAYENMPGGKTFVGRMIDKKYLNSIGWVVLRQKKVNLQNALENAIDIISKSDRKPHIMDIAAGACKYVLDTLKDKSFDGVTALLRDCDPEVIAAINNCAKKMELECVTAEQGDAFDADSLAEISPKPNIVIISGLYEWRPNNDAIIKSLSGVSKAIESRGIVIYTGRPWYPQLEKVSHTLTNLEGKPWVMRRRCQAELDEIFRSAGFRKIDMLIDEYGVFTVSTAIKDV